MSVSFRPPSALLELRRRGREGYVGGGGGPSSHSSRPQGIVVDLEVVELTVATAERMEVSKSPSIQPD